MFIKINVLPVNTLSTVIKGIKSPSVDIASITKLSARADILKADNVGRASILVKNCVTVTINISLPLLKRLKQQFAKVKFNL